MADNTKISNVKRLQQIINVLIKHGMGHLVTLAGLDSYVSIGKRLLLIKTNKEIEEYTNPERLVMVFEELGPTFIKLGQILSTRKDQLPKVYIKAFEKLQDSMAPLPFEKMDMVFESEFGKKFEEVFDYIDKSPIASGSIGQVHAARLKTGEEVVVKIRKPGIEHVISADIKILYFLANQLKKFVFKDNDMLDPVEIIKTFEKVIKNELDFILEAKNIERFQNNFKEHPEVYFPKVHWEYSSLRILVMEKINGIAIGDVECLKSNGHDLKKIAVNLYNITLKQMFTDAFFHADTHPGNFIIMENNVIGIIDCGMVSYLEETAMNAFIDCFTGLFLQDYDMVVRGYTAVGTISEDIDVTAFKNDVRNFLDHYMDISLNTISIGTLLGDAIDIGIRHRMKIPVSMIFTTKALVGIEGTIKKLDPAFDFVANSVRVAKTLIIKRKLNPKKVFSDILGFASGLSELLQRLPKQTAKILTLIEDQKITVKIDIQGLDKFSYNLKNMIASLALGIMATGLGVASSLVIQAGIKPLFYGISLIGIWGYLASIVLGLWVIFIILRKIK